MLKRLIIFLLLLLLTITACGNAEQSGQEKQESEGSEGSSAPETHYEVPPFAEASFHLTKAQNPGEVVFDTTEATLGYVAVSAIPSVENKQLLFQVLQGELCQTFSIDLPGDGTPAILSLPYGSGDYVFRVMENTEEDKYIELAREEMTVELKDEFQPYLRTSDYVPYNQNSKCVKMAADMAKNSADAMDLVGQVFDYVKDNITYDTERAQTVQKGYTTDPDETLEKGTGICFDYASLVAAMLRSQGIPTKVIFGNVVKDGEDVYHAWNMFYTEETGWVTVEYQASGMEWSRLDLTFSAGGAADSFVIDDANYYDMKYY